VLPAERLLHERPLLRDVPDCDAEATRNLRGVERLGAVRVGYGRYSVTSDLIAREGELLIDSYVVRVLHRGAEVGLYRR
jgi:hypothetical protein